MPDLEPEDRADRPTMVFRASWWSEQKDMLGQWVERVVVRLPITEDDISRAMETAGIDVSELASFADGRPMIATINRFRRALLAETIVEMTNSRGEQMPTDIAAIKRLKIHDVSYVADQLTPFIPVK